MEQHRQAMLQLHMSDKNVIAYQGAPYIRGLTVLKQICQYQGTSDVSILEKITIEYYIKS